ncbi:MAG: membrane dipeptidase [Cytophagaceae bacterium]|nr:membrane dipeptidase [Gemmatimonadaceae bacterium]
MTTRRNAIQTLAAAAIGAPFINRGRFSLFPGDSQQYSERCIRLMRESIVVDMLAVFSLGPDGTKWMMNPDTFTAADAQRWKDSGITAIHPAQGTGGPDAYQQTFSFLSMIQGFVAAREEFMRIDSADDFARAKAAGRVGVILGVQNSQHFRTVRDIDAFHALGQRISQLTYNSRNMIGNGSTERRDEGLSDFGVSVVEKMNTVGMAIDVSHCGDRTSLDAFEVSKAPVLITHSNARALNPGHPRCKPDEVIRACGKAGSIMGITNVRNFVKDKEPTTIEDYVNHFEYVAKMIGIEQVGIGSDIDLFGYDAMPPEDYKRLKAAYKGSYAFRDKIDIEGVDHPRRMYNLTEALIKRGYTDAQLTGILGGNAVRVLGKAWTKTA